MRRRHHDLLAWQEAILLVQEIYAVTRTFPSDERFGLVTQMRRAAVSVPSNIAEGAGRTGEKEFLKFLSIARGSLSELETQALIAINLGYVDECKEIPDHIDRVFSLIGGLINSIRKRIPA